MSKVYLPQWIEWGTPWLSQAATWSGVSTWASLADVDQKAALIFSAPRSGTINQIAYRQGAGVAGAGSTRRISLQNVDLATGFPDGTPDQYRTGANNAAFGAQTAGYYESGILSDDGSDTGNKRSVTKGDLVAVVFDWTAYGSGSWNPEVASGNFMHGGFPYCATANTTGVWAKTATHMPVICIEYDEHGWTAPGWGVFPATSLITHTVGNATTPDEIGLRFQVPFDCTIAGVTYSGDLDGPIDVKLYDSGDNVLATGSHDPDTRNTTAAQRHQVTFTTSVELTRNTTYRVTIVPNSATTGTVLGFAVADNKYLAAIQGGIATYGTERTDGGAWTDTSTERHWIGLLLSHIDDGTGGTTSGSTNLGTRLVGGNPLVG